MRALRLVIAAILSLRAIVSARLHFRSRRSVIRTLRSRNPSLITHEDILITTTLDWQPCYQTSELTGFSCVNLEVPLDYGDPTAGNTHIALIRHTGNEPESGEDILFNPGGPGVSGIDFFLRFARETHNNHIFPPKYNLVSFDPRGVGQSGINVDCFVLNQQRINRGFGSPGFERPYFSPQLAQLSREHYFDTQPQAVRSDDWYGMRNILSHAEAFGEYCTRAYNGSDARYAGTVAVAQDLLHFIKLRAVYQNKTIEEAKLNFFGLSYGSALGTTFAALYPQRVGFMILDGVEDVVDYYIGDHYGSITQLDAMVGEFFQHCYNAGSSCGFYKNDSSATALQARFDALLDALHDRPIALSDPSQLGFPTIAISHDLLFIILLALYNPHADFEELAHVMLRFEERKQQVVKNLDFSQSNLVSYDCKEQQESKEQHKYEQDMSLLAITCIDTQARGKSSATTVEELKTMIELSGRYSKYFGALWNGQGAIWCGFMQGIKPPDNQIFRGFPKNVKTATPILFTGNYLDPVTPGAYKMSAIFEGSRVLEQNTLGHCAWPSRSKCLEGYINRYFDQGELPGVGITCEDSPEIMFDKTMKKETTEEGQGSLYDIEDGDARRMWW